MTFLNNPISSIKGIGPAIEKTLYEQTGILTIEDLLYYRPRRYIDRTLSTSISQIDMNKDQISVSGIVTAINTINNSKRSILKIELSDETGKIYGTFFGGIFYLKKMIKKGDNIVFSGKPSFNYGKIEIIHPEFDFLTDEEELFNTSGIVPIYALTEKLREKNITSRFFRKHIKYILNELKNKINDPLPKNIIQNNNFLSQYKAILNLHFPESNNLIEKSRQRLAFNELFFLQYYLQFNKEINKRKINSKPMNNNTKLFNQFISSLPFHLTDDQNNSIKKISKDIFSSVPMRRLLQGDVGTGKTAVAAALSMLFSAEKYQTALMAPTEVLAIQHYKFFKKYTGSIINISLLTGSTKSKEKNEILSKLKTGAIDIIIGTHSLFQKNIVFNNLKFIIIDEQHRFGVNQRAELINKGENPDLLVMTATPIPRSLALTLYADLDQTIIKQKPSNRKPIKTLVFPESRQNGIFNSMEKYMSEGRQCFYVLPLIDETERSDLKSVKETHKLLSKIFINRKVALLHGKMKSEEKESIMNDFSNNKYHILVTTTVIEVGIDVPNANVIIIHHAERFGLSQLHQLRGRVGRGEYNSYCILVHPDNTAQESIDRLKFLEENDDGFAISEYDLKIRGAGYFSGIKQHGFGSDFKFVNFIKDTELVKIAKKEVSKIIRKIPEEKINETSLTKIFSPGGKGHQSFSDFYIS